MFALVGWSKIFARDITVISLKRNFFNLSHWLVGSSWVNSDRWYVPAYSKVFFKEKEISFPLFPHDNGRGIKCYPSLSDCPYVQYTSVRMSHQRRRLSKSNFNET